MDALELAVEPVTVSTVVVHVSGELDGVSASQLESCVTSIEPGFLTVVLDMHGLTFLDSMGIGLLVALHRQLDGAARLLQLRNVQALPLQVLETTDVHRLLHLI